VGYPKKQCDCVKAWSGGCQQSGGKGLMITISDKDLIITIIIIIFKAPGERRLPSRQAI